MFEFDYQRYIDRIDEWIVERSRTIMLAFLVLTVVFAGGATMVTSEAGTSSFTEDNPAQQALDAVNQEFTPPFESSNGTTQLLQTAPNALAKDQLLYMLEAQELLSERESSEVIETSSAAQIVAWTINPNATTIDRTRQQ